MKLDQLFDPVNGIASSGIKILPCMKNGTIAFVRPASTIKRTIAGFVRKSEISANHIFPPKTLFVSTNGEGSHTYSYVSDFEFVPNSDVTVLIPKIPMKVSEKIFYATCITKNRFKFSFGRKPKGQRLMQLEVPDQVPQWVRTPTIDNSFEKILKKIENISVALSKELSVFVSGRKCRLDSIFDVEYGTNLELNALVKDPTGINFVSRSSRNNGVSARVKPIENLSPIPGGVLSVAAGGSVLETFVQLEPFYSGRDLLYLSPKINLSVDELLFYSVCIRANRFRYSYGRQANRTIGELSISSVESIPTWVHGALQKISKEYQAQIRFSI